MVVEVISTVLSKRYDPLMGGSLSHIQPTVAETMSIRFSKSLSMILFVGVGIFIAFNSAAAQDKDKDTARPVPISSKTVSSAADKALLTVTPEYIIGPEDILEITVSVPLGLRKQHRRCHGACKIHRVLPDMWNTRCLEPCPD